MFIKRLILGKKLSIRDPETWSVLAALQLLFVLTGWFAEQGMAVVAGLVGVIGALAARYLAMQLPTAQTNDQDVLPEA